MGCLMEYLRCDECGEVVDKHEALVGTIEFHSEVDSRQTEYCFHYECPYCGSQELSEVWDEE